MQDGEAAPASDLAHLSDEELERLTAPEGTPVAVSAEASTPAAEPEPKTESQPDPVMQDGEAAPASDLAPIAEPIDPNAPRVARAGFRFLIAPLELTSCSVAGEQYAADENGVLEVRVEHASALAPFGCRPLTDLS